VAGNRKDALTSVRSGRDALTCVRNGKHALTSLRGGMDVLMCGEWQICSDISG